MHSANFVYLFLLLAAVLVVFSKKLIHSLIFLSLFSMLLTFKYFTLKAPDVAITEAALGTGLATVVYLVAIKKTRRK
jgi:energy-converting hydrogenase B subunit D